MKLKNNKAFTIIELIVVIAILGILVLLAGPRLLGYVEKAELTRIQHDVKVMENKIAEILNTNNNFDDWQNNGKDLGRVVMRKELHEKQGVAKSIDWEHLSAKWLQGNNNNVTNSDELGMGGNLIEIDDKYSTYKIIPKEYSDIINTKLKGTFYVNSLGKVYYEHDKPLTKASDKEVLACVAPETLNYEFEIIEELGTITGWSGNATHLVIPSAFKVSDGDKEWCEPVRVIGAGAFQNGTFKRVIIPQSIEEIQDEAFQGGELIEIKIPHSVINIGDNAFTGNPAASSGETGGSGGSGDSGGSSGSEGSDGSGGSDGSEGSTGPGESSGPGGSTGSGGTTGLRVIVKGSSSGRNISASAFGSSSPNYSPVTNKDLGVITKTKINSNGQKSVVIIGNKGRGSSHLRDSSSDGNSNSGVNSPNTVINIPKELEVNGELLPITEIDSGAFQGSGLIDVIMPEGLLYIHDYAFAGNQLIRAVIPNSVIEVGNYAFAYNEIASKPTIDPINILESKFAGDFNNVNNEGNISQPISTIDLKDHIFIISSMGNHVIEDIGANPEQPEDNNDDVNNKEGLMNPIEPRDPIEGEIAIDSADDLNNIRQSLNGEYILTSDIDLSGINWVPIGNNSSNNSSSRFRGSFDGNGYNITGLTIDKPETDYIGLFGYTHGATIKNVALENIDITGARYTGGLVGQAAGSTITNSYATGEVTGTGSYTGGLVGYAWTNTTISNSYFTGSVSGTGHNTGGLVGYAWSNTTFTNSYATGSVEGKDYTGGLVGYANTSSTISNSYATGEVTGGTRTGGLVGRADGSITNSYSTGEVTSTGIYTGGLVGYARDSITIKNSYATGSVSGGNQVGGLAGYANSSSITNSYATGSVSGGNQVGGLVGYVNSSSITNSYATGSVSGTGEQVGGLVGYASSTNITSSYWNTETTGQDKSARGEGKTTNEMKVKDTYQGWDFENTWEIEEGQSYPALKNITN